jgi:hypothetical protein
MMHVINISCKSRFAFGEAGRANKRAAPGV